MGLGDVVKIKGKRGIAEPFSFDYADEMQKYAGKLAKIVDIDESVDAEGQHHTVYYLDIDNCNYFWHSCFLSRVDM